MVCFPNFKQKSSTSLLLRAVTYFSYVESINFEVIAFFVQPNEEALTVK